MYQALVFEASDERVHIGTGQTVAEAVTAAHNALMSSVDAPANSQDDVMANTYFSLPDAPNAPRWAGGEDCPDLIASGAPFLIIWGCDRMHIPLGVVHLYPRS